MGKQDDRTPGEAPGETAEQTADGWELLDRINSLEKWFERGIDEPGGVEATVDRRELVEGLQTVREARRSLEIADQVAVGTLTARLQELRVEPGAVILLRVGDAEEVTPESMGMLHKVVVKALEAGGYPLDGRPQVMVLGSHASLETLTDAQLATVGLQRVPFETHPQLQAMMDARNARAFPTEPAGDPPAWTSINPDKKDLEFNALTRAMVEADDPILQAADALAAGGAELDLDFHQRLREVAEAWMEADRSPAERQARAEVAQSLGELHAAVIRQGWETFQRIGLLWWVNRLIHTFGWSIVYGVDADTGELMEVYPARTSWLGFPPGKDAESLAAFQEHILGQHPDVAQVEAMAPPREYVRANDFDAVRYSFAQPPDQLRALLEADGASENLIAALLEAQRLSDPARPGHAMQVPVTLLPLVKTPEG